MDPSGARKYVYEPLSYDSEQCRPIRLVRVLPGKPDTPICCELFNSHIRIVDDPQIATSKSELFGFRLGRAPHDIAYNALSYVWGNTEDRVTIRVNGKDFSITRNLWIFLDRHRRSFTSRWKNPQVFWIDAICIDQGNLEERSEQVAFMADIYREAEMVLVWLGEGDSESHRAFEIIKSRWFNLSWAESLPISQLPIFQTGYWDRLWIVQEIFHARRITVRCSTFEVDWERFISAFHRGPGVPPCKMDYFKTTSNGDNGYELLCLFAGKACLDPRDAVYALRSLAPTLKTLVPDYSLSTADVFTAATRASIIDPDCLNFLDELMDNKFGDPSIARIPGLPSWVPDWTMGYMDYPPKLPGIRSYNSGGSGSFKKQAYLLTHPNPRILLLEGIPVDTVAHATEPYIWRNEEYTSVENAMKLLQDWLPGCETSFRKLWDLKLSYGGRPMRLTFDGLLEECARQRGLDIPMPVSETELRWHKWEPMSELAGNAIVITKNGYRGFVFGTPKVNDLVFVAYGARYPYVLRQADGNENECFSLVGNALIKTLMCGEAIGLCRVGKLTERVISLV
ncbi:HET-domain-containing protein [Hyaloscypha variabilis F]|uniref:HET-domain-containing protein n=1 Tax=Hyaloscypha variabilis (strain UAMH 11265 / GT02V1 / F) TaxID=1149755 RepID=A0A2J6RLX6_HYAVF|nr:HET-domain-containing protein [Hyaloscypha variabilis F]